MNSIKAYFVLVSCVLSLGLSAQETFKWIKINDSAGNYYEMHRIDFLNSTSLSLEFTIPVSRFEHPDMTGWSTRIESFEYTDDRTQVYFIEDEGDIYRYTIVTDQLEYIRDLTPETTPFPLVFGYTNIDEIFFLNDSILYCGGFTHGFYNINSDSFQKLRDPASNAIAFSEFEQEMNLTKGTWHKGDYIYSAGGISNSIRKLEIGDPEANTELLDFDQFNMRIWFDPIVSYRDACGKTTLYQGGSQNGPGGIKDSYWEVDLDNGTIAYSHPFVDIPGGVGIGNVKHYKEIDWNDCQRVIDLDEDDSSIAGVDFLIDSLCSFDLLPLSDLDIVINNEYEVDSVIVKLVSPLSGVLINIPNGNYDLQTEITKITLNNNGSTVLAEFEEGIRNGFINNLDNLSQIQVSFTVWYDGVAGNPAIATYRFAMPLPYAGDDIMQVFCEKDEQLTLENMPSAAADVGGIFYNQAGDKITTFPTYQAMDTVLIYYVTTNGICYDSSSIEVIINKLPDLNPMNDISICDGDELDINISLEADDSILWNDGISTNERIISTAGEYIYTIKNNAGCTISDSFEVILQGASQSQPIEARVCEGETFQFMGTLYTQAGSYKDTLHNSQDCDSIIFDILISFFEQEELEIEGNLGICEEGVTDIEVISSHTDLQINGIDTDNQLSITEIGNYVISGYDLNGCYEERIIEIITYPYPEVETSDIKDTIYSEGLQIPVLYKGKIEEYHWTPSLNLDCDDCPYPHLLEAIDGKYIIEVVNEYGCTAIDTVVVSFKATNIYLPNIISINADNPINRVLFLQGNIRTKYDLQIYDRWGGLLFDKSGLDINESSQGWEPSEAILPGVYIYKLSYDENGNKKIVANDITVIR